MDLDVQATLDLHMFPDKNEVLQLLKAHNFKVTKQGSDPDMVLLEGTFLNLRAVRPQLQKHLQENGHHTEHRANRNRPVSASDGIATGAFPKDSHSPLSLMNGSHHGHVVDGLNTNSSEAYLSERSLAVSRGPTSFDRSSASSRQLVSSYCHSVDFRSSGNPSYLWQDLGAPQSLPTFPSNTLTTKPPLPLGTSSTRKITLPVDADVFRYTCSFRKDRIDTIIKTHGVECIPEGNSEIKCLTLRGKDCEKAREKLENLFQEMMLSLRTHEIPLSGFNHAKTAQMASQIQKLKDVYKVLVRQTETSIVIIGSPADSYAMKQQLLGEPIGLAASGRTGRSTDRGPRSHRSLSVPKSQKLRSDQDSRTNRTELDPSTRSHTYSPANYKDDYQHGGTSVVATRRRTNSESRERTEAQRPVPKAQPEPMTPSSGHQMPSTKKYTLGLKGLNLKGKFSGKYFKN